MTTLNERATTIFRRIIDGLTAIGHHVTHDNAHGRFMALHAEIIAHDRLGRHTARIVSLAHYYESNGDLVCDPDVTFAVTPEGIWPLTFEQGGLCFQVAAQIEDGKLVGDTNAQKDLTEFCNSWMANIADQQGVVP